MDHVTKGNNKSSDIEQNTIISRTHSCALCFLLILQKCYKPLFKCQEPMQNNSIHKCIDIILQSSETQPQSHDRACRAIVHSFIHSFITWIYIVPLQGYYSEVL